MRAIAGADEDILLGKDVWFETELLFSFNKSLHYFRADNRTMIWKLLVTAIVDLQLMSPLNEVNMATANIKDTHDITILASTIV